MKSCGERRSPLPAAGRGRGGRGGGCRTHPCSISVKKKGFSLLPILRRGGRKAHARKPPIVAFKCLAAQTAFDTPWLGSQKHPVPFDSPSEEASLVFPAQGQPGNGQSRRRQRIHGTGAAQTGLSRARPQLREGYRLPAPAPAPSDPQRRGKAPRSVARTWPGPNKLSFCPRGAPAAPRPRLVGGGGLPAEGSHLHPRTSRPFRRIFLSRTGTSRAGGTAGGRTHGRLLAGSVAVRGQG